MNAWWHKDEWPDDHPAPSLILFDIVDRNGIFSSDELQDVRLGRGLDSRVVITQTTGLDIVCEQNLQLMLHRLLCSERDESWSTGTAKQCVEHQNRAVEIWANIWITVILDRLCRMSPQLSEPSPSQVRFVATGLGSSSVGAGAPSARPHVHKSMRRLIEL